MYLPAVPPTLVPMHSLHSSLTRKTASITNLCSCLQLLGEFMMFPVDFHQTSTLLERVSTTTAPTHGLFYLKV